MRYLVRIGLGCLPMALALLLASPGFAVPTATRPAPYPHYEVGDRASLIVQTNPPQPLAAVYMFRHKNGEPEGQQPTQVGTTDAHGVFSILDFVVPPEVAGTYTGERYAVGHPFGPRSNSLSFRIDAARAPIVTRPAPFPSYTVGDLGTLRIRTVPAQPNQPVYRYRLRNGQPDGAQPKLEGFTNAAGRFEITLVVPPGIEGTYTAERYTVGTPTGPRSPALSFTISPASPEPQPPIVSRPAPFPTYRVGDTATFILTTDPPQPNEPIYRYRRKNGLPDGNQPTLEATTDGQGRYELTFVVPPGIDGVYTDERHAVGDPNGLTSPGLEFTILPEDPPVAAPTVVRPSPFPSYQVGDSATLIVTTDPPQPNQPIFRYRQKNGADDGLQPTIEGFTDASGRYEVTTVLPAESIGVYTDEQLAVGEADGPRSQSRDFSISAGVPSDEPIFEEVEPTTFDTGTTTVLTLHGANFTPGSTVRVADDAPLGGSSDALLEPLAPVATSSAITARVLSVSPDGTRMTVAVDASASTAVDDFMLLAVDNGLGEKAQPVRVQGPGPIVDAWTPSAPIRGESYVFTLLGNHLADATIDLPEGVSVQIANRTNGRLIGVMTVDATAPAGERSFTVTANGQSVELDLVIQQPSLATVGGTNLLASTDTEAKALQAGRPAPKLFLQDVQINTALTESLTRLQEAGRGGACLRFFQDWHIAYPILLRPITFDLDTGEIGQIAASLGLGNSINVGTFVLSLTADLFATFDWLFCPALGFNAFEVCVTVIVRAEVPGGSFTFTDLTICSNGFRSGRGGSGESQNETSRLDLRGNFCTEIENQPVIDGIGTSTITQIGCCGLPSQPLALDFAGTTFGVPFDFTNPEIGDTVAVCPAPEGEFRVFLDVDDDNPFDPNQAVPIDQLDDLDAYLPGAGLDGTSLADLSATPQRMKLVAAYVDVVNGAARVVPPPADITQVAFALRDTSAFVGVASNWPVTGGSTAPDFHLATGAAQATVSFGSDHTARVDFVASDYGGFTTVEASAVGGTDRQERRIPLDDDGNLLPDAGWRTVGGAAVTSAGLAADADADAFPATTSADPVNGKTGDGLSVFEEYRGFVVRGNHRRTHPGGKDVFISSNLAGGIGYAFPNLPLTVHRVWGQDELLLPTEYDATRNINFNQANGGSGGNVAGHSLQKAIRGLAATTTDPALLGEAFTTTDDPETPNETSRVEIYPASVMGAGVPAADQPNVLRRVFGHEVGHALHICHRPISAPCTQAVVGPGPSLMTSALFLGANGPTDPASQYDANDQAQMRLHVKHP